MGHRDNVPDGAQISPMRALPALTLAILIVLTSQTLAMARGQATASGQMVFCSVGQVVTVSVDAEGKPVGPAHICPDCVMHVLDLSGEKPPPQFSSACRDVPHALADAPPALGPSTIIPKARAPPLMA